MPVIIKLFFSPFSFYSLKMYRKMHVALMEEKAKLEAATRRFEERDKPGRIEPEMPTVTQRIWVAELKINVGINWQALFFY